jgi:antitoxin component of MazEF toxin-antitoxin module
VKRPDRDEVKLRRILRLGTTYAITIPPSWLEEVGTDYVFLVKRDGELVIKPVRHDKQIASTQ